MAEFARDRLNTVLPKLQARLAEIQAKEYLTKWLADYEAIETKRDALAAELREAYPAFATRIADLFARIAANDAELSRLHQARPSGCALHLLGAELVARNLESSRGTCRRSPRRCSFPTGRIAEGWLGHRPRRSIQVCSRLCRSTDAIRMNGGRYEKSKPPRYGRNISARTRSGRPRRSKPNGLGGGRDNTPSPFGRSW